MHAHLLRRECSRRDHDAGRQRRHRGGATSAFLRTRVLRWRGRPTRPAHLGDRGVDGTTREIASESSGEQTKELDIFGTPCALFRPQELLETSDAYRNASNHKGDRVGGQLVVAQACDRKHEIELRAARMPRRQARAATHDVVQHHVIFEIDEGLTTRCRISISRVAIALASSAA